MNTVELLWSAGPPSELFQQYYDLFGCKPCCATDLKAYICLLTPEELQAVSKHSVIVYCIYYLCGNCCTFTDCLFFYMPAEIVYQKMAVSNLTCWVRSFLCLSSRLPFINIQSLLQCLTSVLRCDVDFVLFGSMEVKRKHLLRTKFWFLCFSVSVARTVCGIIKTYNREWISSICSWCGW